MQRRELLSNLLAWNTTPSLTAGLLPRLPSLSPLSGADVQVNPGFDFFAMPVPQAGSSKIVFISNREGNAEIYSMNADGSGLIRLTTNASNDDHPRWSPDGTKILFQSDRDNPETGSADIYVMNADGTGQTRLTSDVADDSAAVWSPDGNKIVFQSLRNGLYYQVYVMSADGTNQVNVSGGIAADYQPSWSPDGSKIAFASDRDHAGTPCIYVMNANGLNQTRLTFGSEPFRDEQPAWSRDATKLAFVSTRDSVVVTWQETDDEGGILNRSRVDINKEVYKMNTDGSSQVRLTNTLESDDSPYWSPDGTQIIFRSDRERDAYDPSQQLWTMNADGTGQTLISSNEFGDYSPSWNTSAANQPPIANPGGPYSGIVAQNVPFDGSGSFDPDGAIASYSWSFGDGGAGGTGAVPTHTYTSAGTYTVTLTVTDNLGAQASANTSITITTAGSEQYLANFNLSALARPPSEDESAYWNDILRAAFANGQNSMLLSIREMGKTLFESSDYAALERNNHMYVYDLYKTYLMREPDAPGWAFWEACAAPTSMGREGVRRAFDESGEFAGIVATLTPSGSPSSTVSSFASARVDPFNQPGNGLTSRDTEWSVSLLSLPGRAGLDLGLSLSYSSMVWTRSGPYIYFDEDNGSPSPGFRLGFPTIQEKVFDAQAGDNVYLLIAGSRVSLRQVGTSNVYEAADSSYLQLIDNGGSLLVRSTDGTQLSYLKLNNEWRCTQIKDRNGNYLTVNYDEDLGHITTITDTLARVITFNYDSNDNLISITQDWTVNGNPQTHTWATFGWATKIVEPSFSGVMVVGAPGSSGIPVLSQVGLDDGSRHTFEYNAAGQVNPIRSYGSDNIERTYTAYDYDAPTDDCPRLSEAHIWAQNWTGINGVPQEVATVYGDPGDGSHTVTAPDGTLYKEFYGTGWQRGLTTQTEVWSAGVKQKWTTSIWKQDNESPGITYQTNPRVTETNVHDASNHRRTTIDYQTFTLPSGASCSLPGDTREYAGSASTALRHTHAAYRIDPVADTAYLSRHIIGMLKEQSLFEVNTSGETLMSKVGFQYDETASIQGTDAPVQHDNSYDGNFVTGRGNLSSVKRYDVTVTDNSQFTMSSVEYNTAGAVVSSTDPLSHQTAFSYADSFSDNNNSRNTLAYPTTVTDADGYSSTVTYNFDFGGVTRKQTPQPNTTGNLPGPVQTFLYDSAGRLEKVTATNNGAYRRFLYGPNYVVTLATVNNVADEAYSNTIFDGLGRTTGVASNHPGSVGGYKAQLTQYDLMGRAIKESNPAEINGDWNPAGDDAAGWLYTEQTYDWQGRPRITTNTDLTTKEAGYSGCGCAGGAVVTLTDEGTMDAGVFKRRQQKIYSDIFGRTVKTELLNWQGGDIYSTTVTQYNARDQVKLVRQYAGPEGGGTYQDTTMTFDGYGRLKTKHEPEQDAGTASTWDYNDDDALQKITGARGASATYGYNNNRHLPNTITYYAPTGVASTPNVSFEYDAAGNRTSMTDGSGSVTYHYDQLSRMDWEERTFTGLSGAYRLDYDYNLAGQLTSLVEPTQFGSTLSYAYDFAGRLEAVTGSEFGGVTTYASDPKYRAWGGLKHLDYGDSPKSLDATYNSRLQAATFDVPGVLSKTYEYYADGSLRFSSDLLNHKMDRFNAYDHAARIKEAFSGAEARGEQPTNDRPYRQTFGYDALGHLTTRASNIWQDSFTTSDTYLNNRRADWGYDAEGNLLAGADSSYTYDAAGRISTVASFDPVGSTIRGLDGTGQQVRTDETAYDEQTQTSTTTTKYYLRSSVLGGQVLTEIAADGGKLRTFVYAGGSVLAWQVQQGTGERVVWEHRDASGASFRTTDPTGYPWGLADEEEPAELDPTGANAGFHAPLIVPPPPDEGSDSLLPYPRFSDPRRPGVTYAVDGIPVTVDYFFQQLETSTHGSFTVSPNRFSHYSVDSSDGRFDFSTWREAAQFARNNSLTVIQNWIVSDNWSFAFTLLPQTPQNPAQPSAKGFPCPPSVAEIFTGRDQSSVGKVLSNAGELFPKTGREEGGWIYMNRKGRLTAGLNERGGQNVTGLGMAIDLNSPPVIRGSIVVATFHTHDVDMDPSMPTGEEISLPNDIWTNETQGVPGIIIGAGVVRGFNGYGPQRGYWRQPLPKRCQK